MNRTSRQSEWVIRLAEAALTGDPQKTESAITAAIKNLRTDSPEISKALANLLGQHMANPKALQWAASGPPPADAEEGLALVRTYKTEDAAKPVLSPPLVERVRQFIRERQDSSILFHEGLTPTGSILLIGEPGTGKTMLARWLASELQLPFLVQDLATSISSLLGKTGLNLRRTLDYARSRPCLLLLDEFDAIAKRRDDFSELGELKRIVNVLLKELEDWPAHSVLIAATNHPALLDPAISRRFHLVLNISLPGEAQRKEILERAAGRFKSEVPARLLKACAQVLKGKSGSHLEGLMSMAIRRHVTTKQNLVGCLAGEMAAELRATRSGNGIAFTSFLHALHGSGGEDSFTVRDLAALFERSPSTIQYHLNKGSDHG